MLKVGNKLLKVGDKVLRKNLASTYSTSTQGGITPSNKNKLIFIFSDPKIGEKFGYNDGFKDGVFYYSGRGPKGDMQLTFANKSIIQSLENDYRIFVFSGAKGLVTYEGEFFLDQKLPFIEEENLDEEGVLRTAILFRLLPNKRSKKTLIPKSKISISKKTSCKTIPLETGDTKTSKSNRSKQEIIIEKNEKKLINKYSEYLKANNYGILERNKIEIQNESSIYTDGWINRKRLLLEAKSNTTREKIRMAIGQLFDYERFIKPSPKKLAILVPKKPRADLIKLLDKLSIMVIYPEGKIFVHYEKSSEQKDRPWFLKKLTYKTIS